MRCCLLIFLLSMLWASVTSIVHSAATNNPKAKDEACLAGKRYSDWGEREALLRQCAKPKPTKAKRRPMGDIYLA